MTSRELPQIKATELSDLIETVPYLMGFHPSESLVLLGFLPTSSSRVRQVSVTMRTDLPVDGLDEWLLAPLVEALTSSKTATVVAFAFTESVTGDPRAAPWLGELTSALVDGLGGLGLHVLDVLAVNSTSWWSMCCRQPKCCPPLGKPRSLDASKVAATATYAGLVALPDRQALAATLDGRPPDERAALEPVLAAAEDRVTQAALRNGLVRFQREESAALLDAAAQRGRGEPLTDEQLARFAVALTDGEIRDLLWLAIDSRSLDATAFLSELHSRLPPPYDASPLFLYGWDRWRSGNGTLAAMAAERALESDPEYSAAELLLGAVSYGMDPGVVPLLARAPEEDGGPLSRGA
jgi:hypothetical protein